MDLYKLTAHELHEKLVNKEVSSVELTNAVIARVDAVEDQVNSYVTLDKENALAQAAKVDAKIAAGEKIAPLAGIPGAIKDNISTKGLRTTCSSKMLAAMIFAFFHDSGWMPSCCRTSASSVGPPCCCVLKNQLSIMASASATAEMPETWEPFLPLDIAWT